MNKTYSDTPIDPVSYYPLRNGEAEVYLRENIGQETQKYIGEKDEYIVYTADEVHFRTRHPREYVEEHFDELWVAAETAAKPLEQRVAELEEGLGVLIDVVLSGE